MAGPVQNLTVWGRTLRTLGIRQIDSQDQPARFTGYGDLAVVSPQLRQQAMDEGAYFTTTNPTPGTGLAYGSAGTQATFSDTVPFFQIINTDNPGPQAKTIWLDYLKLIHFGGTAPASSTSVQYTIKIDNGYRASTAGTPTSATPVSPNMNLPTSVAPVGRVVYYTGAVATIPAASQAARVVGRGMLKGGPTLLLDQYTLLFGGADAVQGGYLTTVSQSTERTAAVGIGPGQSATIHLWMPSAITNPFTYEFEMCHFER